MEDPNYKIMYENLLIEVEKLKEHLKKYTAPSGNKKYYEKNKELLKIKMKEYRDTHTIIQKPEYIPTTDKKKEYNRRAYEKRKLKKQEECLILV
jgi:hypothetical protein